MNSDDDLFALFYEPLQRAVRQQNSNNEANDYLDDDRGLAASWSAALQKVGSSTQDKDDGLDPSFRELEQNTWALLQALYTERTSPSPSAADTSSNTDPFYYTPPLTLVQSAIAASPALSELTVVKDWLHSTAYNRLHPAEVRKGYLTYTKNKLKQALRTGGNRADLGTLVDTLDPDATNRKDNQGKRKTLDPEDAGYEKALLRTLWEYVRVGELDQALDMCRQSDSSWRAASLSGGKLYSNDTLARARSAVSGDTESMDIPAAATDGKLVQGNIRRKLWKSTCRAIADSEHVYTYERALYGAISGQTKSVLPVCETWEDYLWVHVNSLLEQEIDNILERNSNTNYFLSSSSAASEEISASSEEQGDKAKEYTSVPQALQNIFNSLLAEPKLRLDARSPFHVAQSWIILNKTNDLLNTFVTKLEENAESLDEPQLAHLLRFFTHLILFLRLINTISSNPLPELPEASVSSILTSYLRVLQAHSASPEIIAFYSGSLSPSEGIEAYARYLYTEYLSTPNDAQGRQASERSDRRTALLFAREAGGLDLSSTARRVVEMTLADVYAELPDWNSAKAHFGLDASVQSTGEGGYPNSREMELIRSIEWLTCDKETYLDALTQANALMRYFLCAGSPHLARKIVHQIPPDLLPSSAQMVDQPAPEDEISEYLDYTSFFDALQLHGQFSEVWSRRPGPSAKQSERLQYAAGIANLTNTLYDSIVELLTSEWLILLIDAVDAIERNLDVQRRLLELQRIRAAYIPELVFRLHYALLETGKEYVPSNLHKALELSNVVADERYKLYIEFMGDGHSQSEQHNRLKEYLGLVRQASLACLERQGDVFGGNL